MFEVLELKHLEKRVNIVAWKISRWARRGWEAYGLRVIDQRLGPGGLFRLEGWSR